jgi:hypothetical protein
MSRESRTSRPRNRRGAPVVTLGVTRAKSRGFGACVVSAALLVAGCSSGGAKQSAPTTTAGTTTTTTTLVVPGGQMTEITTAPPLVAGLGACPSTPPILSLPKLPAVVESAKRTLVPIAALNVRICEYGGVPPRRERSGRIASPAIVKSIEDTANRLARSSDSTCDQPVGAPAYVVTFADNTRQVVVSEDACGFLTNGARGAESNARWLRALRQYTAPDQYAPTQPTG